MPKLCPICRKLVDERHRLCAECGYDWMLEPDEWWITPAGRKFRKARREVSVLRVCLFLIVALVMLRWIL